MTLDNGATSDIKSIIKIYRLVSEILFKFGVNIIIFITSIFGLFTFFGYASFENSTFIKEPFLADFKTKINGFSGQIQGNLLNYDSDFVYSGLNVKILRGNIYTSGDYIYSFDNFLSWSGLVLPSKTSFSYGYNLKPYSYFSGGVYEKSELLNYLKKIVLVKDNEFIKNRKGSNNIISMNKDIISDFKLSCLFSFSVIGGFCKNSLDIFTSNMYKYSIFSDIESLKRISSRLDSGYYSLYKGNFCKGVLSNIYYGYSFNESALDILKTCGTDYVDKYSTLKKFKEISDEINNNFFSDIVYDIQDMNHYKLISFQQSLYNSLIKGDYNDNSLSSYISYISKLLQKESINPFYKDETYTYNNKYLVPTLNILKSRYSIDMSKKIDKILDGLDKINIGDYIIGYKGLENDISNINLIDRKISFVHNSANTFSLSDYFTNYISNFSFIVVINKKIDTSKNLVQIRANMNFVKKKEGSNEAENTQILGDLLFKYDSNEIYLTKVNLVGYDDLNNSLNSQLSKTKINLNDFYDNVISYIGREKSGAYDMCSILGDMIEKMKGDKDNPVNMTLCTNSSIEFTKGSVSYSFKIQNGTLNDINISEKNLETHVKANGVYKNTIIQRIPEFIIGVLSLNADKDIPTLSGGVAEVNEKSNVGDKFYRYLGVNPSKIQGNGRKYAVEFTINGILFKGLVTVDDNYKFSNLYIGFDKGGKDIKNISVKGFSIYLIDSYKDKLNSFKLNPMDYIKSIDPNAFDEYKTLNEKK